RVKGPRTLSGPGGATVPAPSPAPQGLLPDEPLAGLAARYGLTPSAARPGPGIYIKQLWQRRHFVLAFATARNVAMYSEARLGQVWQILTPLLNAAVYFLIFGVILDTRRGVPNFIAFLVTGIFIFNFTQRSFIIASRVINDSLQLIRALHFPRACLPLGYIIIELQQMLVSMAVLVVIVLATGEPITWLWLLAVPAIVLQTLFNVGVGFILARIGSGVEDVSQLIPFIVRTWMYASGVMFFIPALATLYLHKTVSYLLQINPAAVYIELVRNSLLASLRTTVSGYRPYNRQLCAAALHRQASGVPHPALLDTCHFVVGNSSLWFYGGGWAVLAIVIGYFVFWQAEVTYGRG
ncbi:MAG TPA: ABC transporter permease, partial [Streptosporangiaceae bacterium]|nr:ABC transporter permease [Streptosporangiaceae bacterium]